MIKTVIITDNMVTYIENLRMFSVKFLELMCEGNYVVKKDQYTEISCFSHQQQMIENQILKRCPK